MENKYRYLHDLPMTLRVEDLMPILGLGPVSYTHLDVYKRQIVFSWGISVTVKTEGGWTHMGQ